MNLVDAVLNDLWLKDIDLPVLQVIYIHNKVILNVYFVPNI